MTIAYLDMIGKKPRADEEARLQAAIWQHIKLFGDPNAIAYAVPNGEYRSKRTGARLKAQGVLAGVPDLAFVLPDGRAAFMELKKPGGRLSPEQRAFMDKCIRLRIPHALVADIDSALGALTEWGIISTVR